MKTKLLKKARRRNYIIKKRDQYTVYSKDYHTMSFYGNLENNKDHALRYLRQYILNYAYSVYKGKRL